MIAIAPVTLLFALAVATVVSPPGGAQKGDKKRLNDPAACTVCQNDPVQLEAGKIVAHEGFVFGKKGSDTAKVDKHLATCDIRWIETPHFRIGFALGPYKVKLEEKKKFLGELTKLKQSFPKVAPETGILDSWLRLHLIAQRCEEFYERFVRLVDGEGATFADGSGVWSGAYMGEGPYLGMKEKFELIVLPNEAAHVDFLLEQAGLRIRNTQRWHFVDRGAITVSMHAQQGGLRHDAALHGHIAHNLGHNLYDALNHYSYDTPAWLHEGLAHFLEREIDPNHNSFDGHEGAVAEMTKKANWKPDVLKLVADPACPRLAEMVALKNFGEMKLDHHFVTWSMIDFLVQTKPKEFAAFLWALKRNYDERGIPMGQNLPEWHRTQFKQQLGMSYVEFDTAWREWVKKAYQPGVPKGGEAMPQIPVTPGGGLPPAGGG